MTTLTESDVEAAALAWLAGLVWQAACGPTTGSGYLDQDSGMGAGRHTR